jgi:hypothetical protein
MAVPFGKFGASRVLATPNPLLGVSKPPCIRAFAAEMLPKSFAMLSVVFLG